MVVAIIGLISSIAFVSMQNARAEARDTKRLADLDAIRNALELYYNDYGVYPDYKVCNALPSVIVCDSWSEPNNWIPSLVPKYMPTLPSDPLNITDNETNQHYIYLYTRYALDDDVASQKYYLLYRLERKAPIVEGACLFCNTTWSQMFGGKP